MNLKIALVGNPNCGKTTMFNALTGSSQYVGNWPGVAVEKKSGKLKNHNEVEIIDLPGIYSLSPYTLEEVISRNYLLNEKTDVLIHMWERGKSFIKKAGTIIFVASITIWFLSSFNWTLTMVDTADSILASLGMIIALIFVPLSFATGNPPLRPSPG